MSYIRDIQSLEIKCSALLIDRVILFINMVCPDTYFLNICYHILTLWVLIVCNLMKILLKLRPFQNWLMRHRWIEWVEESIFQSMQGQFCKATLPSHVLCGQKNGQSLEKIHFSYTEKIKIISMLIYKCFHFIMHNSRYPAGNKVIFLKLFVRSFQHVALS